MQSGHGDEPLHHARKNLQSQLRRMGVLEESGHE